MWKKALKIHDNAKFTGINEVDAMGFFGVTAIDSVPSSTFIDFKRQSLIF